MGTSQSQWECYLYSQTRAKFLDSWSTVGSVLWKTLIKHLWKVICDNSENITASYSYFQWLEKITFRVCIFCIAADGRGSLSCPRGELRFRPAMSQAYCLSEGGHCQRPAVRTKENKTQMRSPLAALRLLPVSMYSNSQILSETEGTSLITNSSSWLVGSFKCMYLKSTLPPR